MFETIMSAIQNKTSNDQVADQRRRYERRSNDRCMSMINGKPYPVKDWSLGGMKISADARMFSNEQKLDVILKFKLRDDIINISQSAHVVRRSKDHISLEFLPLTGKNCETFQQVVDDAVAREFADSQSA